MKATDLLERQHKKVKSLFKKLESGRSDPLPILKELADDLIAHMVIEHELLYPAAYAVDPSLVAEAFEEHALGELALKRLLSMDPEDESFEARVTAAKELIEHHVKEEEEELFPKLEKKLGDEKLEELGKLMKTRFAEARAVGHESTLPKGFGKTLADSDKKLAFKRNKRAA